MAKFVTDGNMEALLSSIRDYIDRATGDFIVLEDGMPLMLGDMKYVYPKLNT